MNELALMPHQKEAVAKMMATRVGALFMEMGTGKTRTAIALVQQRRHRISNVVWFCPVSLKETIRQMIEADAGESPYVFDDHTTEESIPPDRLYYVVGIESMSTSARMKFAARKLVTSSSYVIVDESSFIKHSRAKRTKWITDLAQEARYRLILNGTPISQGVEDLYAQMTFLSPRILGYSSFGSFARNHLEYSEKYPGKIVRAHNTEYLAAKMKPYVYQVQKSQCLTLPPKLYEAFYFYMTPQQRTAYNDIKEAYLEAVDPYDMWNTTALFQMFTGLQRVVCGYTRGEDKEIAPLPHERITTLLEILERVPDTEKVIIWAKFHYDIEGINSALLERYGDIVSLHHGAMTVQQRSASLDAFRGGNRFFVSTESCGGFGLTLNEANTVVFYDNQFKFSQRLQAEDRCHRIGQERPVTYIDIVCAESIDQRIMRSLQRKEDTLKSFLKEVEKVKDFKMLRKVLEKL